MSDEGLKALCSILLFAEAIGVMPPQASILLMVLLPKPDGGLRPIGIFKSLFRVWARLRRSIVKSWESNCRHFFFAACKDKSPVDVVFRQALKADLATAQSRSFGIVLWDLLKCYEHALHPILYVKAKKYGYPLALLRMSLAAYIAPRRIMFNGIVSDLVYASRTIVAGSTFATSELVLYLLDTALAFQRVCPAVSLNIFIDDLAFDVASDSSSVVVQELSAAAGFLAVELEDIGLPIAKNKTVVLANTMDLNIRIRKCLRSLGGKQVGVARNLGVDFYAGRSLSKPRMPVRKGRLNKVFLKLRRLGTIRVGSKKLASHVFVSGCLPGITFGSPVTGLHGNALRIARSLAASYAGIKGAAVSHDLAFALCPSRDPEQIAASSVVWQFCKEVWSSSAPANYRQPGALPLGDLCIGIKKYTDSHKEPPRSPSGPLGAFHAAISLAGWSFKSPLVLRDRSGSDVSMVHVCPKKVLEGFKDDLRDAIGHRGLLKLSRHLRPSLELEALISRGIFWDPLAKLFNKLQGRKKFLLLKLVGGGVTLNFDLFKMGYEVDPACNVCGQGFDCVHHHCFLCPSSEARAAYELGHGLFNYILSTGNGSLYSTRFFAPKPVVTPPPAYPIIKYVNVGGSTTFTNDDGNIYVDGSCTHPKHAVLSRAAFALVQVDGAGEIVRSISATLPSRLRHTPLAAETAALAAAIEMCGGNSIVATDCAEVQRSWNQLAVALTPGNASACSYKAIVNRFPDHSLRLHNVRKVKAHRSLDQVDMNSEEDLRDFIGNAIADNLARQSVEQILPDTAEIKEYFRSFLSIQKTANYVLDVISGWPPPPRTLPPRLPFTSRRTLLVNDHCFKWSNGFWRCSKCLKRTSSPFDFNRKCTSHSIDALLENRNGHTLWGAHTDGGQIMVYCSICWAYAISSPNKLCFPCKGPPVVTVSIKGRKQSPFGDTVKARILKRLHPADVSCRISQPHRI